jgi:hypothetical protein
MRGSLRQVGHSVKRDSPKLANSCDASRLSAVFAVIAMNYQPSDTSFLAEILSRQRSGGRRNSKTARCYAAVPRCLLHKNSKNPQNRHTTACFEMMYGDLRASSCIMRLDFCQYDKILKLA